MIALRQSNLSAPATRKRRFFSRRDEWSVKDILIARIGYVSIMTVTPSRVLISPEVTKIIPDKLGT
jgi:hypothetical protein